MQNDERKKRGGPVRHFSFDERKSIEEGLKNGTSLNEIAWRMNRPRRSIRDEIKKRSKDGIYSAEIAQDNYERKYRGELRNYPGKILNTPQELKALIKEDYQKGMTVKSLRMKYCMGHNRVLKILKSQNVAIVKRNAWTSVTPLRDIYDRLEALEMVIKTLCETMEDK